MKTLIVFYSLEGSTKTVAEGIAGETDGDLFELKTVKPYPKKGFAKYFWGGKSATFGESPALENTDVDLTQYDKIIFGTPIWVGTFAPPVRTFIRKNKIEGKRISIFACSMGSPPKKAFSKLKKLLKGNEFGATEWFIGPVVLKEPNLDEKIKSFAERMN